MKKFKLKDIGFYILVIGILLVTIYMLYQSAKPVEPPYSDVYRFFKEGRVVEYTIEGNVLTARLDDETVIQYTIPYMSIFIEDLGATIRDQLDTGKIRYANYIEGFETPWWMMFIPYLVVIVIFVLLGTFSTEVELVAVEPTQQ